MTIQRKIGQWVKSANGNGVSGTVLALEALMHMAETGDSTVFAKMAKVENAAYVKNLKIIAKGFGYKFVKLDSNAPSLAVLGKDSIRITKGMDLDAEALSMLEKCVEKTLQLGGTGIKKVFEPVAEPAAATDAEPATATDAEPAADADAGTPVLDAAIETPEMSVLDLVLNYMADMSTEDLGQIQALANRLVEERTAAILAEAAAA